MRFHFIEVLLSKVEIYTRKKIFANLEKEDPQVLFLFALSQCYIFFIWQSSREDQKHLDLNFFLGWGKKYKTIAYIAAVAIVVSQQTFTVVLYTCWLLVTFYPPPHPEWLGVARPQSSGI